MDALCTVADVQAYPGLANAPADTLSPLIDFVSAEAINASNMPDREDDGDQTFFSDDYTESYDGNGTTGLLLRHCAPTTPVTAVRSVLVDGRSIPKSPAAPTPGFVATRFGVELRGGYIFCRGIRNVVVRYTAGVDPSSVTAQLLKAAAVEWVALVYKQAPHIDIRAKTLDRETVSFFQAAMPVRMQGVIENLRNRVAA